MDPRARPLLRPILPAASAGGAGAGGGGPGTRVAPKRKNTDAACLACRKRKVRCDGIEPRCSECVRRRVPCEYPTTDGQNSRAIKKKLTDMEERLQAHEELYSIMQTKTEEESLSILNRIRSGQDVRSVLRHLQDGDLLLQVALVPETWHRYKFPYHPEMPAFLLNSRNQYLQSRIYKLVSEPEPASTDPHARLQAARVGDEAHYRAPYYAARIVEPRVDAARPSHWTLVPASDSLLKELLRLYFLHEYPTFSFFHKDYFLEDMAAGRKRFCSSMLVNSIFAAACHAYAKAKHRTEYWNPQSLQYQFVAEARRIRELEIHQDSLTTLQASLIMALTYNVNGVDEIGWSYALQTIEMADRMKMFDPPPDSMDDRMKAARGFTAWALFSFQSLHYLNIVMVLMEPFTTAEVQTEHSHDIPQETPENVVIDAKVAFETILRLYYLRHGFDAYDPLLLQFQLLLGFMSLKTLSSKEKISSQVTEAVRSTLALALKGVRGHASNTYLGVTTFRLLRDRIEDNDTKLLQGLADVVQEEETVKSLIASHVKSQYPINVMSMEEDPEERRIGTMVAAYKDLDLSDVAPGEGSNKA
ncbi:hypothetical protein ACHAPJ_002767 [Fusarium lateritium]